MKWSKFCNNDNNDEFVEGDYNALCEISGFKIKASQMARQWDGVLGRKDLILERNPQDYVQRAIIEKSPQWTRVEPDDQSTNGTNDGSDY